MSCLFVKIYDFVNGWSKSPISNDFVEFLNCCYLAKRRDQKGGLYLAQRDNVVIGPAFCEHFP